MNKTKKITLGAMFLAIAGALMLLDARFGFLFASIIVLVSSVIIILYSTMYTLKDGLVLAIALGIITFIYGVADPYHSFVLYPASALTGLAYSYGLKKDFDRKKLLLIAIVIFVIGELISALVILPLVFDFTLIESMESVIDTMQSFKDKFVVTFSEYGSAYEPVIQYINLVFAELMSHIVSIGIVTTAFTGAVEGVLIHLLSIILLKRFKIKDIKIVSFIDVKPNKVLAYLAFLIYAFNAIFGGRIQTNEVVYGIFLTISYVSFIYLLFLGYMTVLTYFKLSKPTSSGFLVVVLVILLMPLSLIALLIIGFLYGSGPLYKKLQEKRMNYEKNNAA